MRSQSKMKGETHLIIEKYIELELGEIDRDKVRICYSLWRADVGRDAYILTVSSETERATVFAGENEQRANKLFRRCFEEKMLPENLYDVYRDMLTDEKVLIYEE